MDLGDLVSSSVRESSADFIQDSHACEIGKSRRSRQTSAHFISLSLLVRGLKVDDEIRAYDFATIPACV